MSKPSYICPNCSSAKLSVECTSFVTVTQGNGAVQTHDDFDLDWDDNSHMKCNDCEHEDSAVNFRA